MQKYSTSFTDIPYKAGTVNHTMKNEMAKITDIPYKAGTFNHATRLKRRRLLTYFGTWLWYGGQYRGRRNRETNEKRESRLEEHASDVGTL